MVYKRSGFYNVVARIGTHCSVKSAIAKAFFIYWSVVVK